MPEIRVPSNFSNPEKKDMGQKTRLEKISNPKKPSKGILTHQRVV
jgi:hypothetical protein